MQPLGFVGRTLTGLLLLGLFVAGAAAIAAFRPRWTGEIQGVLNRQAALSFAVGLIANVLMLAIIGFLYITICLRPPALLLGVGLLAFNVAGMAAVGAEIGGRISERLSGSWTQTSRTALGVFIPGAIIVFLWAVGGCFGFFGNMGALLLGSFGVGAILVKALNLGATTPGAPATRGPAAEPTGTPAAPTAVPSPAPATTPVTPDVPPAPAPAAVPPASRAESAMTAAAAGETTAQPSSEPEPWWVSASTMQEGTPAPAATAPPKTAASEPSLADTTGAEVTGIEAASPAAAAASVESLPAEAVLATPPAVSPAAALTPGATGEQADFTRLEGIGPKLNQRLHAANIHTFADLAALPPETLAGIFGWTSERLLRTRVVEQAKALAQ
jgi:predicted flap endonuclease-1-like 5' DNA nuclease